MMRWDIINHLIKKNNYKSYLEIGYYKGWSFDNVNCLTKTAVDPNPSKTQHQQQMHYGNVDYDWCGDGHSLPEDCFEHRIFKLTSDDYFSSVDKDRKWDIIFIDGLHEANQAMRDVKNSIDRLSKGGTIVLHDCNPPTFEHTTTGVDGCWTGDIYKVAAKLAMQEVQVGSPANFYTVDTDWGVGVMHSIDQKYYRNIEVLSDYFVTWEQFEKHRKLRINLITPEEFLQMMNLSNLPGVDSKRVIPSNPDIIKENHA